MTRTETLYVDMTDPTLLERLKLVAVVLSKFEDMVRDPNLTPFVPVIDDQTAELYEQRGATPGALCSYYCAKFLTDYYRDQVSTHLPFTGGLTQNHHCAALPFVASVDLNWDIQQARLNSAARAYRQLSLTSSGHATVMRVIGMMLTLEFKV